MKTLHTAYRVGDLTRALDFYDKLGYLNLGVVDIGGGTTLSMLKFAEEPVVSLELVYRPDDGAVDIGTGFHHLVVQVDELAATLDVLTRAGLEPGPIETPGGEDGPKTAWLTDPDGYRIELVEWPASSPDGLTAEAFG